MKTTVLKTIFAIFAMAFIVSCSNSNGNDVSKDPKYADVYNQFFFPTQTLYYYDYTSAKGKSGKFLSMDKNVPNAKLIEEIQPGRSRLIVTKIFEVGAKNTTPEIMVEGRLHKDETSQPMEFLATWKDIKQGLRK